MDVWQPFAAAQVGASAALAGLVFVGVSINLARIVSVPGLAGRAAEALAVLLALLVVASLLLVPGQTAALLGAELLAVGLLDWAAIVTIQLRARQTWSAQHPGWFAVRIGLGQAATLPFVAAGIGVLLVGESALGWLVVGTIGAFAVAFLNAWVLLIEIER